ncbi:SPASM domain-containing protein [Haematospirillum jordaniae]|nr:SPASM domain-containing protein [Haematospirillum jordaniae]
MRCAAPWYEMNVQAPDNSVSTCCYYYGNMPFWDRLENADSSVLDVWNHPDIQYIRRIQMGETTDSYGCEGCGYFSNQTDKDDVPYFNFEAPPDLSEKQRQNFDLAKSEFESRAIELKSLPLRQFFFFGYQCNIDMYHVYPDSASS